ncbi:hypothetical protein [Rhodococcus jostii]|uniref:hypothetical protein n=1 Tax=Rhodococcus jostii TaxID=132919 RepID=UPI00115F92CF|nr:hypothetical protein [Rhodococcus jostii]
MREEFVPLEAPAPAVATHAAWPALGNGRHWGAGALLWAPVGMVLGEALPEIPAAECMDGARVCALVVPILIS